MGNRGARAAYKAAVWRYLQSDVGRTATAAISARLMGLPELLTGVGPFDDLGVHALRVNVEHLARNPRVSNRVFVVGPRV